MTTNNDAMLSLVTLMVIMHVTGSDVAIRATPDPVAHLTTVTNQLSSTVNQLNSKLTALKADLASKSNQINSLTTQIKTGAAQISNLTRTLNQKTNQLNALDSWCKDHVNGLTNRIGVLETPIAFSARFQNDSVHAIRKGYWQNLIFDVTVYQTGGENYNRTTGLFIAPSTGTYAFFLTIQRNDPDQNDCVQAYIIRNNRAFATASACPTGYSASSNMATTWLRTGDRVYVRTSHSERVFGYVHSTFSGFKLTTR